MGRDIQAGSCVNQLQGEYWDQGPYTSNIHSYTLLTQVKEAGL